MSLHLHKTNFENFERILRMCCAMKIDEQKVFVTIYIICYKTPLHCCRSGVCPLRRGAAAGCGLHLGLGRREAGLQLAGVRRAAQEEPARREHAADQGGGRGQAQERVRGLGRRGIQQLAK